MEDRGEEKSCEDARETESMAGSEGRAGGMCEKNNLIQQRSGTENVSLSLSLEQIPFKKNNLKVLRKQKINKGN